MADSRLFRFLGRSLDALKRELPSASHALGDVLGHVRLRVEVDGDVRFLLALPDGPTLTDLDGAGGGGSEVTIRIDDDATRRLLSGELTLLDSVLRDAITLRGAAEHLIATHDFIRAFVEDAARSLTIPPLLARYLGDDPTVPVPSSSKPRGETHGG